MTLRIFNSLTRQLEIFRPINPPHVRMYVCGMTVYDLCHMGHARLMVSFDIVVRWLRAQGYEVTYVRNITDIDDKIIQRSVERGVTLSALTQEMITAMHQDTAALGIEPPTVEPRATDFVPHMLSMIETLQTKGLAYQTEGGDVHFSVRKFPSYGQLSGKLLDQLRAGERVAVGENKHDPLDFVLWKSAKDSEPEEAKWPSPFGLGRPGWHIECSAMGCSLLGEHFDIHGGGLDLQFPHHENEIAQTEGVTGRPWVNVWMHNGFLNVDGEKMSKSTGNFFSIREVLGRCDGETLRFFLLRTHYRSPFNFSDALLEDARQALRRLYTGLQGVELSGSRTGLVDVDWTHPQAQRFQAEMNEDFNTPGALAVLFELTTELHRGGSVELAALIKGLGATLGLLQQNPTLFLQTALSPESINEASILLAIRERTDAKLRRDFAAADSIRERLRSQGVELKDSAKGTTWMRV